MLEANYRYVAVNAVGRRARGIVQASDEAGAFVRLRQLGLSPITLRRQERGLVSSPTSARPLSDAEAAGLLESLALLLSAGSDIRTSLTILRQNQERSKLAAICTSLSQQISGGVALEQAFASGFGGRQAFVAAIVAAAEAAGDLPGGLRRAASLLQARLRFRAQLIATLAYPGFVAVSAIITVLVILLFVVPAIEPMAEDASVTPPLALRAMIAASTALRQSWRFLLAGGALLGISVWAAARVGLVQRWFDRALLDGPSRGIVRALIYGRYAGVLGNMLAGGANVSDALRLSLGSVGSEIAQARLEPVVRSVRQGDPLSTALDRVRGFPSTIARLTVVGEASNTLGEMLSRGGELEEQRAITKIEAGTRIAGPVIVILLGALLAGLMAALLSGISGLGQASLS